MKILRLGRNFIPFYAQKVVKKAPVSDATLQHSSHEISEISETNAAFERFFACLSTAWSRNAAAFESSYCRLL